MMYRKAATLLVGSFYVSAFQSGSFQTGTIIRKSPFFNSSRTSNIGTFALTSGPSFCEKCGSTLEIKIPQGDERKRHVCRNSECGYIVYNNPKVVRAIEPCKGKWGYPQGYLELGETTRQGAARETWEEAGVHFDPSKSELIALYNLAGMQIQTIYRVELESDEFEAGHESSDVRFVTWDDIPWDHLAFPTVQWGLEHAKNMKDEIKPTVQERTKFVTLDGQWKVEEG
eukprot:CCRYP_011703-RA/>CCRYP_011703-RA protein AED:0.49 eAED:0.49 QI:0/0/0/1/1/1/2/0/227